MGGQKWREPGDHAVPGPRGGEWDCEGPLGIGRKSYQGEAEMAREKERGKLSHCLPAKGLRLKWLTVCFPFLKE